VWPCLLKLTVVLLNKYLLVGRSRCRSRLQMMRLHNIVSNDLLFM
jgi:hypothetical protein